MSFMWKSSIRCSRSLAMLALLLQLGEAAPGAICTPADSVTFLCKEFVGRPTGNSIALSLRADKNLEVFVEYGTQPSVYGSRSSVQSCQGGIPFTLSVSNLTPDTRYYYRVRYRITGTADYLALGEHTFHTARPAGRPFVFAIEADPHLDSATDIDLYKRTLANILNSNSDFLLDLGDTFMTEKLPVINQDEMLKRYLLLRSCFDTVCHSIPLMLVQGNHDGELGWLINGTADNLPVWATNLRKSYFPNPEPDGFYSGDTTNARFTGRRQNYYAWEWGNALFVVLDVYWYTAKKPGSSKNNWDWTLGKVQYDWLRKTLEGSKSAFKFVFAHQVVGGNDTEGRGGIEAVPYFEMGGLNSDGTSGFASNRPGWPKPIHQLMVENHVSAFFHGHDHVFVKQDLDGIVYHELPQPGYFNFNNPEKSYSNINQAALYGYTHGVVLPSSGYLRVTVADTGATVDYIRSYLPAHENSQRHNGEIAYSYTLNRSNTATLVDQRGPSPGRLALNQNYPNPFNPSTTIQYDLPVPGHVTLVVYNLLGQVVDRPVDDQQNAGTYRILWDSSPLSSGVYVYHITVDGGRQTFRDVRRMVLLK